MTGPVIHRDVVQGTAEWHQLRAGIPTASEFDKVLREKGRGKDGESVQRRRYMMTLASERLTGRVDDSYRNAHFDRGHEQEPEARDLYSFITDAEIEQVGFITNHNAGYSPDGLIGTDGGIEIKSVLGHILLDYIDRDVFPAEHRAQVQGGLWVSEREWIDLVVYSPGLPLFRKRATRDESFIAKLDAGVAQFNDELEALVERIRRYGAQPDLRQALRASVEAA